MQGDAMRYDCDCFMYIILLPFLSSPSLSLSTLNEMEKVLTALRGYTIPTWGVSLFGGEKKLRILRFWGWYGVTLRVVLVGAVR